MTKPKRSIPLPSKGPWDLHIDYNGDGDRNFQLQASDGEVVCNFLDSHYDGPGKAEANAFLMFRMAAVYFKEAGIIDGDAVDTVPASRRLYSVSSPSKTRR